MGPVPEFFVTHHRRALVLQLATVHGNISTSNETYSRGDCLTEAVTYRRSKIGGGAFAPPPSVIRQLPRFDRDLPERDPGAGVRLQADMSVGRVLTARDTS